MKKSIAITVLGVLLVIASGLAVYFGIQWKGKKALSGDEASLRLEQMYRKNFEELSDSLKNIEVNLAKTEVSNAQGTQALYLAELIAETDRAAGNLAELPLQPVLVEKPLKFVNQLNDYARSLSKKLHFGKTLSAEEKEILTSLHKSARRFSESLQEMSQKWAAGVIEELSGMDNDITSGFDEMSKNAFDYPQLIYDGPFSDQKSKTLTTATDIGAEAAEAKGKEFLMPYRPIAVEFTERVSDERATVYNFQAETECGQVFLQVDGQGRPVLLNNYDEAGADETDKFNKAQCIEIAEDFAKKCGLNVKANWVSQPIDHCYYVNMTYEQDGIAVYPDMVKMLVCTRSGKVRAMDAFAYWVNHKERRLPQPRISATQAENNLRPELKQNTTTLAVVPDGKTERLCYEIFCSGKRDDFIVYVDALTGEEFEIFKVLYDKDGFTVM